jgi:N-acetylmuramoyl-L-alanine amidase
MIAALRTGIPRERPDAVRLVLDLERADIPHEVKLDDTGRQLDIVLGAKPGPKLRELIAGKKILLDAGHGGRDAGAMYHNVPEKDLNLEIVDKLASKLEEEGLRVVRSRTDDSFVSLSDRVEIAQEEKPLLVISLHSNSLDSVSSVQGIETYYYTPQSKALAVALHDQLVNSTGAPDRRVRKARFVLLRETDIPSVLVEMGFMSNPTELRRLQDPDYQGRIVDGLRNGTLDYLTRQLSPAAKMP